MARDLKYGEVTVERDSTENPLNGSVDGEPVFVLRAQDRAALATLAAYRAQCITLDAAPDHVDAIERVEDEFRGWQDRNSTKLPD